MVTHNLGVAAYMSDYIIVMKNGKMEDQGLKRVYSEGIKQ